MQWKNLSEEAKSIIEWVVSPIANRKQTIEIKIGDIFHKGCPRFCRDYVGNVDDINIRVTKELYQEILKYVTEDENIQCKQFLDGLIFRLKDEWKFKNNSHF